MDLNNVDLNLLVAFDALLTERSVTKAADRLSVGQSAMSSTLNRLRKLLDDPVLVRQGRGVVATPLAESLVEPVRDALSEIDHILSRTRVFDPAHDRRRFAVIANDSLTMTVLQPLLARFAREASGVRLDIDSSHEDFAGRLARHEVDLVIVPIEAFEQQSRFPHRTLYHDRYVVAADKDHPDIGDELDLEQFSSLPYLATHAGRRKTAAELQLDWLGVVRKVEATASLSVAPFLLRGTRLITLVLERVARQIAEPAGIRVLEPPITGLRPIAEAMVWTRRTELDPAHQWLRGRLMDLAAEMTPGTATDPEH